MTVATPRLATSYLLIGMAPIVVGIVGVTETHDIAPAAVRHVAWAGYIAPIRPSPFAPLLVAASDDPENRRRSSARLFEDGRELRSAHALRAGIAAVGKGRFSHWTTGLHLSSSDNSDPRTNGRVYRLETVARMPAPLLLAWLLTVVLGAALWRHRSRGREPAARSLAYLQPVFLVGLSLVAVGLMIAGPGAVRFWALASWLTVGFVAALCAATAASRVSIREWGSAVAAVPGMLVSTWNAAGTTAASFERRAFEHRGWRRYVARGGGLALAAAVFVATLAIVWPEWILLRAYGGGGLPILVAAGALWLAHTWRGWLGISLGLAVTVGL